MKKTWVNPAIEIQQFEANEYVAACIVGTIACALPGVDPTHVDDGTETYVDSNGQWHGMCGNWATISFDSDTRSGYEVHEGNIMTNRPISNISGYTAEVGEYNVTWNSNDGDQHTGGYSHTGVLKITSVDPSRPNHS